MNDAIVTLVWELDESTEEKQEVFAHLESVGQKEFFAAAQSGFKSEYKLTIWESDYTGQSLIELNNKRYSVYRTFLRRDQKIELYLTDKVGVANG